MESSLNKSKLNDNNHKIDICDLFVENFRLKFESKNSLYIGKQLGHRLKKKIDQRESKYASNLPPFHKLKKIGQKSGAQPSIFPNFHDTADNVKYLDDNNDISKNYDLIVGELPLGLKPKKIANDDHGPLLADPIMGYIFYLMKNITIKGHGLFTLGPSLWYSRGEKFVEWLMEKENIYICAAIDLPNVSLSPFTSTQPQIIIFSKIKTKNIFIAQLDDKQNVDIIIDNFIQNKSTEYLDEGIIVKRDEFKGFHNFRFKKQIENLSSGYKKFRNCKLIDVVNKINLGSPKKKFSQENNTIYIPNIGRFEVKHDLNALTLKQQNYFQIILNDSLILSQYAASFYNSSLGITIRESIMTDGIIRKMSKNVLMEECVIAVPEIQEQKNIIKVWDKIVDVNSLINNLSSELSINPQNAEGILEKLEDVQGKFTSLTEGDKLKETIRSGESEKLEFKSTWSYCLKALKIDQELEDKCLYNLAGFMNRKGGILLIGVDDVGKILGIEKDLIPFKRRQNPEDAFLNKIKDKMKNRIGLDNMQFVNWKYINVNNNKVLQFKCIPAPEPVLLDGEHLYVRYSPGVEKLTGQELINYMKNRFT